MSVNDGVTDELICVYGPPDAVPRKILNAVNVVVPGDQIRFTDGGEVAAPEPDTLIVVGEFEALLVTVIVLERLPVVMGANVALNEVD